MNKFRLMLLTMIVLLATVFPLNVVASPLFIERKSGPTFSESVQSWTESVNGFAPTISFLFSAFFTILFLIGVVRMGYSIVTKTGQVMKGSTGILIWVPISFFIIRLITILIFTTNIKDVTLLASEFIRLIQFTGYYSSIGMVLIGLVLFMFYRFIHHPEYGRWSKRLWVSAILLSFIATLIPTVFGAV
jgi:hypothetical protein